MYLITVLIRLGLTGIFGIAGVTKLIDQRGTRDAVKNFGSPDSLAPALRNPRSENILVSGDRVLTLGVNWTLNRFVKIQVNGIREHVEDPDRNPVPNGAAFWSRVLRLQFVL